MKRLNLKQLGKPAIITLLVIAMLLIAGFTGCTLSSLMKTDSNLSDGNTNPPTPPQDENNNNEVENEPEPPVVVWYNVLTGLETTSELADLRPVSVCIANSAYALPQDGISQADIIIEMPTESGQTRLLMLTTSYEKVATIGSVQSVRSYMLEVAGAFGAIHCFNGSDDTVSQEVLDKYDTLDYVSQKLLSVYYKDDTRVAPNDLMTNGILIDNAIDKQGFETKIAEGYRNPYVFVSPDGLVVLTGGNAKDVTIDYSADLSVNFLFNTKTGLYERYQYGEKQIDGNNGNILTFENLFILFASSVTYDTENGTSLDLVMEDGGSGYYCTNGKQEMITWQYNSDGSMSFFDSEGNALEVNRGTSYIGFVKAGCMDQVTIQ